MSVRAQHSSTIHPLPQPLARHDAVRLNVKDDYARDHRHAKVLNL